ncbi:hypothetical protein ASAC_0963 [Acidilobus saccharovorans 345-15]|uniref:Uncharacterized protein n=1 Tax=Acidilobus saccharovorans (strain DSM 16705 / JCM 18335 / VKM B-2471 / 345-15) TaxID=666510 RepID=D9Q230_ACIS3|nr:ParB N-terminal domain-containing protein [Acidilobus saccharovorans]ADL19368.1 hypothetical protein ASAC_0963 [Acidilobus saccharovorans 345-15]
MFIPERVDEVLKSVTRSMVMAKPLVVAADSWILVDGAHRLEALKRLGARYAPAVIIDYNSDEVKLLGWVRSYSYSSEALNELRRLAAISKRRNRHDGSVMIWLEGLDSYYDIKKFESLGFTLRGVSTSTRSLAGLIVIPPPPTKDLVVRAAMSGELLPPKATRHITAAKNIILPTSLRRIIHDGREWPW